MKRRVKIVKKPKAQSGLEVKMGDMNPGLYGTNGNRQFSLPTQIESSKFSKSPIETNSTLRPVSRDKANIEAERGEVIMTDTTGDGIPETYKVGGDRHYAGGTPLNVPADSFVFSDTKKMKLKDEDILKMFNTSKKSGGITPADIAKKYDINEYQKILADPDSDKMQRETAEAMITNYNLKLAKLALAQESLKGFPQGIPKVAMPYIETSQTDPAMFTQTQGEQEQPSADMGVAQYGGLPKAQDGAQSFGKNIPGFSGNLTKAAKFAADPVTKEAFAAYLNALNSGNVSQMLNTADVLEQTDVPNSVGWLPWTDQDKLQDLSSILKEKAGIYKTNNLTKEFQNTAAKQAEDAYNAVFIKEQNAKTPLEKLQLKGLKDKLSEYHPIYRKVNEYGQTFYTPSEMEEIKALYDSNKLPEVSKPPVKTLPGKKKAVAAPVLESDKPSVDTYLPSKEELINMSDEDYAKWKPIIKTTHPTYAVGGELDKYQGPGKSQVDTSLDEVEKARQAKKKTTNSGNNPAKGGSKKTTVAKEVYGQFNPYASQAVRDALYDPEMAYYEKDVAGKQKANPKGGYGNLDFAGFEKNNADILKRFEEKFKHKYVKKSEANPETKWYQEEYNKQLDEDAKAAGYNEAQRKEFVKQLGFGQYTKGDPRGLDEKHGDWTNSRVRFKFKPLTAPETKPAPKEETPEAAAVLPPVKHLQGIPQPDQAPWWLQDIIKTAGAAGDFGRIKKYQPWQATPGVYLPTPTFYDPTRELAANAEQANIQTQALGQFAGPQALSARSSSIQGQAAKNAADIMGKYNNLNVGTANDFEIRNAGTLTEADRYKAGLDTQLFDKHTIANQQFDNSRNLARQNLRQSYIDAVTNRANTYNLNTVYPQYAVDPMSGGFIRGHNFKGLQPYSGIPGITDQGSSSTADLDKLIEKYGEDKGLKVWETLNKRTA